jgi:hypothetical protein
MSHTIVEVDANAVAHRDWVPVSPGYVFCR